MKWFTDVQAGVDTDTKDDPHVASDAQHTDDFSCQAEFGPAAATNVVHCSDHEKLLKPSQKVSDAEICH